MMALNCNFSLSQALMCFFITFLLMYKFNMLYPFFQILYNIISLMLNQQTSFFFYIFLYYLAMQSLEQETADYLNQMISWAKAKERQMLREVLSLEKKLNRIARTIPMREKQTIAQIELKEEAVDQDKISRKVQELIQNAEESMKNIENPRKQQPPKIIKEPEIEKKPPIPIANRAKNPHMQMHYPKPPSINKSRNQVTGKITQMAVSSRNQVFKPDKSSSSFSRQSQEKKPSNVKSTSLSNIKKSSEKDIKSISAEKQKKPPIMKKQITLARFQKQLEDIVQQTEGGKRKKIEKMIQKLREKYDKEQMSYAQNEERNMLKFLKSNGRLCSMKEKIPSQIFLTTSKRGWKGCRQMWILEEVIDKLKQIMSENPISEDYRTDAKELYRMECWGEKMNELMQRVTQMQNELQIPEHLGLKFQVKQAESNNSTPINPEHFFRLLRSMLAQIQQLDQLDKQALKKLKILVEIGMFDGRRSPIFMKADKYQEWKQFYLDDDQ